MEPVFIDENLSSTAIPSCSDPARDLTGEVSATLLSILFECCSRRCLDDGRLIGLFGSVGGFGAMTLSVSIDVRGF